MNDIARVAETADPPGTTLRLLWPQWQGATADNVGALVPELPLEIARRGYAVGTAVLNALLPAHDGPTAEVPVPEIAEGVASRDGVESKDSVLQRLDDALTILTKHDAERIVTFGGECSVSLAPFATLAARYGDDLAVIWIDSHPDVGTPESEYDGHHAMAVAHLTGHGDEEILAKLPTTVSPSRVASVGLHAWTDDDFPRLAEWGIVSFSPDHLRTTSGPLLDWIASTGCSCVAIHVDVDVIDAYEVVLGLGAETGGLRSGELRRRVHDIQQHSDVVGLAIAEYIPRQVMQTQALLHGFPLI